MTFAAVARIVGESWHRVHAICSRYVDLALTHADLSAVDTVAIDETSYKRGHNYLTLAADADARKVVFVTEGRDADTVAGFAAHLRAHKGFFDVSSGLEQVSQGRGDHVDHGREGCDVAISASTGPGGLEQAVEPFETGIAV